MNTTEKVAEDEVNTIEDTAGDENVASENLVEAKSDAEVADGKSLDGATAASGKLSEANSGEENSDEAKVDEVVTAAGTAGGKKTVSSDSDDAAIAEKKADRLFGKGLAWGIVIGILACGIVFGTYKLTSLITQRIHTKFSDGQVINKNTYSKIQNIETIIDKYFYKYSDDVSTDKLEDGLFRGMLASINDPYAEYYSVEDLDIEMNSYEGISYGIGCTVTMTEDGQPLILGVIEGAPAEAADIKEGDIIVMVDGKSVADLTLSQVVALIKGPENTSVEITFNRDGELIEKTVVRGKLIETSSVDYGLMVDNEDIGYIRISEFAESTVGQYTDAIADLREQNIKGLILDLRSNPGGAFDACVDIARQILPEGIIVYTEDNKGKRKDYTCDGENELDIPLVVLVNGYSASASEILTGAIKDHNAGTIIGETTYGKGIVQRIFDVGDGSAIKLTISAYFTPSGQNIQGIGIEPDIVLEYDQELAEKEGIDNQVNKAVEVLEQKMALPKAG